MYYLTLWKPFKFFIARLWKPWPPNHGRSSITSIAARTTSMRMPLALLYRNRLSPVAMPSTRSTSSAKLVRACRTEVNPGWVPYLISRNFFSWFVPKCARHAGRTAVGGLGAHGSRHPATTLLPVSASVPSCCFDSCTLYHSCPQPCAPPDVCAPVAAAR